LDQPVLYMGTPSFAVPTLQAFITAVTPLLNGTGSALADPILKLLTSLLTPGFRLVSVPDLEDIKYNSDGSDDLKDDFESIRFVRV